MVAQGYFSKAEQLFQMTKGKRSFRQQRKPAVSPWGTQFCPLQQKNPSLSPFLACTAKYPLMVHCRKLQGLEFLQLCKNISHPHQHFLQNNFKLKTSCHGDTFVTLNTGWERFVWEVLSKAPERISAWWSSFFFFNSNLSFCEKLRMILLQSFQEQPHSKWLHRTKSRFMQYCSDNTKRVGSSLLEPLNFCANHSTAPRKTKI